MIKRGWFGRVLVVLGLAAAFSGCNALSRFAPTASPLPTQTAVPTATGAARAIGVFTATAPPSATPPPSQTPQPTASPTPTPIPSPTSSLNAGGLIARPEDSPRPVAFVRWSSDGAQVLFGRPPAPTGYLLDWFSYDLQSQKTEAVVNPDYAFADIWNNLGLGYPLTTNPYSELLGFISPQHKWALFPNAGFPDSYTNPNYIYAINIEGQTRGRILGPIFRGTVGRAAWLNGDARVIFDYRYQDRTVLFLADLVRGRTDTLAEMASSDPEWTVSPDGRYILLPQKGQSRLISLNGGDDLLFDTPGGMTHPQWSNDSQWIYFWAGNENRILRYSPGDKILQPVLVRRELEPFSPLMPVYGMPFSLSPDGKRIAFWQENWIWYVNLGR